jgi:protein phosphatase
MKILSAVHWRAHSRDSVVLKQADSHKGSLVLALLCEGSEMPKEGELASGYIAEEMLKWFASNYLTIILHSKSLYWLKRSLLAQVRLTLKELAVYSAKKKLACQTSAALFLLWRKKYVFIQWGATKAYRYRRKIKALPLDQCSQLRTRFGKAQRGDCFLICSDSFRGKLSDIQLSEALCRSQSTNEKQMAKRLAAIAQYSEQKGAKRGATALMLRIL